MAKINFLYHRTNSDDDFQTIKLGSINDPIFPLAFFCVDLPDAKLGIPAIDEAKRCLCFRIKEGTKKLRISEADLKAKGDLVKFREEKLKKGIVIIKIVRGSGLADEYAIIDVNCLEKIGEVK